MFSIMGGVIWSYFTYGDEGTRFVRKNANSIEAQSDMEAMNKALSIMRENGCTDPMSWYYQGAIHWVPEQIDSNKLCESYSDWTELKKPLETFDKIPEAI